MRVLVTGGAGFIGSHVAEALLLAGHSVVVLDNFSAGLRSQVAKGATLVEGDVRDPAGWMSAVGRVEAVMHLAAQVSVPAGEADPVYDFEVNLAGTVKMLAAAAALGAREFRLASSAAVYGDTPALPLKEDAALGPQSFYGLAKWAAEAYLRHFAETRGLTAVVLRLANVYGPRQRSEGEGGVVAVFCSRVAQGKPPVIHGDGSQTRDFIMVRDVARAFLHRLGEHAGGTFNVGTGQATSIRGLWQMFAEQEGLPAALAESAPTRPGDIHDSVMAVDRAAAWGFHPAIPLTAGILETYAYFRSHPAAD
ncbi:MAG: NAD-dependent epimerase/dehydratase family protein [Thermaerobacter sp.]|nr:NAD-dependent epimerase/dehydratase family protein [Thermaerobacter sp.]